MVDRSLSCLVLIGIHLTNPELFGASQVLITIMQLVIGLSCIAFTILTMIQSHTIIQALNMICNLEEDEWFQMEIISNYATRRISERTSRAFSKLSIDVIGILIFSLAFFGVRWSPIILEAAILLHEQDPIYMFMLYYYGQASCISGFYITALRCIVYLYFLNISLIISRYSLIFYVYSGMTVYQIINLLFRVNPTVNCFSLNAFRKVAIWLNLFKPVHVAVSSGILTIYFGTLVIGTNCIIIGVFLNKISLIVIGSVITMASLGIVRIAFFLCCHICEDSRALLHTWTNSAMHMRNGGYMRRAVQGLSVLSIPAGEVGIFVRDIKMNYMDQVIVYILNVLLICKDVYIN